MAFELQYKNVTLKEACLYITYTIFFSPEKE